MKWLLARGTIGALTRISDQRFLNGLPGRQNLATLAGFRCPFATASFSCRLCQLTFNLNLAEEKPMKAQMWSNALLGVLKVRSICSIIKGKVCNLWIGGLIEVVDVPCCIKSFEGGRFRVAIG
jgi:hypothetical protein